MQRSNVVLMGGLIGVIAACGGGGAASGGTTPAATPAPSAGAPAAAAASGTAAPARRGNANLIVESEFTKVEAANLFEAIQRLRPAMLRGRGTTTLGTSNSDPGIGRPNLGTPEVFLDESHYGDVSALTNISVVSVKEVRFLNASEATTKWGTGYTSGVIQVITKTGR